MKDSQLAKLERAWLKKWEKPRTFEAHYRLAAAALAGGSILRIRQKVTGEVAALIAIAQGVERPCRSQDEFDWRCSAWQAMLDVVRADVDRHIQTHDGQRTIFRVKRMLSLAARKA